ncbi:DUF5719 family protein [Nocardioides sp.]|uniref:DUF5719 family protein n=1 Tax=Nocardioides sp. TaxID=35761 RepID=UPI002734D168|nr:DUF5719 family protein [Nocardioides sp.]MDP3894747.1 DUF5719 family protein [Nocardioides sp.]
MSNRPGRRAALPDPARRALDPLVALAVVLPLLTLLLAATLGRPAAPVVSSAPPDTTDLVQASLVCPAAPGRNSRVLVAASGGASGEIDLDDGSGPTPLELDGPAVRPAPGADPMVLTARGDLAPGLVAARVGGPGLAALACPEPRAEQWFTGVAGDAEHSSVLELVNPDGGPAVADVTILASDGPVDVPRLRGVRVGAGSRTLLDLAEIVPRRDELAVRVLVSRGRLVTTALDRIQAIGSGPSSADWLPAQAAPSTDSLLLGLPPGPGRRSLVVANPGDDETRVQVQVATGDSVFAPADAEEVVVPPRSTVAVDLTRVVRRELRDGAVGLVLTSTSPVTASLRSMAGGDLAHAVPAEPVTRASSIVPSGGSRLLLSSVERVGVAVVSSWDRRGNALPEKRVDLVPDAVVSHRLPRRAALVTVSTDGVPLQGAVAATGGGAAVLPLREDRMAGLVPHVSPGLP